MEMVTLTPAERKLLAELALGFTNAYIGKRLCYTLASVDQLTTRLYDKLEIPLEERFNRRAFAIRMFYRGEYTNDAET